MYDDQPHPNAFASITLESFDYNEADYAAALGLLKGTLIEASLVNQSDGVTNTFARLLDCPPSREFINLLNRSCLEDSVDAFFAELLETEGGTWTLNKIAQFLKGETVASTLLTEKVIKDMSDEEKAYAKTHPPTKTIYGEGLDELWDALKEQVTEHGWAPMAFIMVAGEQPEVKMHPLPIISRQEERDAQEDLRREIVRYKAPEVILYYTSGGPIGNKLGQGRMIHITGNKSGKYAQVYPYQKASDEEEIKWGIPYISADLYNEWFGRMEWGNGAHEPVASEATQDSTDVSE
ncbi:MAG: hypothetical protein WBG50_03185 [Desulfomonilaceae bacterium]